MFVLQPKPTFQAQVTIPTTEGEGKITFEVKHKGRKQLLELLNSIGDGEDRKTDAEALSELITDWHGVDEKFSKENLEFLIDNYPAAAKVIFDTYNKALFEGRQKN